MKKTIVHVRGFDMDFQVELNKPEYLTIDAANKWCKAQMIKTSQVIKVVHKYDNGKDKTIQNKDYKQPLEINTDRAKQYLKK